MSGGIYRDILVFGPTEASISCPLQLAKYGTNNMWTARVLLPYKSKPSYHDRTCTLSHTEKEKKIIKKFFHLPRVVIFSAISERTLVPYVLF